ncbi:MAG: DUF3820 family protein [Pseudomonadota bacterium]
MKIPFGKYKGEYVRYLPDDYLWWLCGQNFLKSPLCQVVRDEASQRWPDRFEALPDKQSETRPDLKRAIQSVFWELANTFHPDHGGNTQAMQALNLFREKIMGVIEP